MSLTLRRRSHRPSLGRLSWHHWGIGPELELPALHSLLVVGPTQSGKTSSLVVPAILRWRGPLVVTSVKRDVVELTTPWRAAQGSVIELSPGRAGGMTWDPFEVMTNYHDALAIARDLVVGDRSRSSSESEFWNALAIKLLGALAVAVHEGGGDVFDLVHLVEQRSFLDEPLPSRDDDVTRVLASFRTHELRTADAVATTVEAMLVPWQRRQPLASVREILAGNNTLYLVAPRHEQRRYEGLLRGALRTLVAEQQFRHDAGTSRALLMVLDEAASVAPLEDLDQLAATGSGMGITLLSVFQDFAQIEARWAERAATIVNNHATRLVLGGLLDPKVVTYLPELRAKDDDVGLRAWPPHSAALISGRLARTTTRLVPWWRSRRLRHRATRS